MLTLSANFPHAAAAGKSDGFSGGVKRAGGKCEGKTERLMTMEIASG